MKDTVPAGGSKVVTFTFKPPQPDAFVVNSFYLKDFNPISLRVALLQ